MHRRCPHEHPDALKTAVRRATYPLAESAPLHFRLTQRIVCLTDRERISPPVCCQAFLNNGLLREVSARMRKAWKLELVTVCHPVMPVSDCLIG